MYLTRRHLLKGAALTAGGAVIPHRAIAQSPTEPRFLVVLTAYGGASIVDSLLAVSRSECAGAGGDPDTRITFADYPVDPPSGASFQYVRPVPDSPFRAPSWRGEVNFGQPITRTIDLYDVIRRNRDDMLVLTQTVTSVNHDVAQARSVNGNGAWRGRTLQEEAAAALGAGLPLPNVHLTSGAGFLRRGLDDSLPAEFIGEAVADPVTWPLALSSSAGIRPWIRADDVARAQEIRGRLDDDTAFGRVFRSSAARTLWLERRATRQAAIEQANLTERLLLGQDSSALPLSTFGLSSAPESDALRQAFPSLDDDPVEAQAALAFLLLKHRVSCAVTLGPNATGVTVGTPDQPDFLRQLSLSFDASHTDHWSGQLWMWDRVLSIADRLISLLKNEPLNSNTSMWDRALIMVATEFGRSKTRPPGVAVFSSGHNLNNGVLFISPLLRGNAVIGGVDPATLETYGASSSQWTPDPGTHLTERHAYALALGGLGVDTSGSGLPDFASFIRSPA